MAQVAVAVQVLLVLLERHPLAVLAVLGRLLLSLAHLSLMLVAVPVQHMIVILVM
jgi:hypothetical protein